MFYQRSDYNTNPGEYKIHTYDKIHEYNRFHDYTHIHDYTKIHKFEKIHTYDKIREYKYQEYHQIKEPRKQRRTYPQPVLEPIKRKQRSKNNWPDKKIYTHKYQPYEYIPPPPHREYVYKEYKSNDENYIDKKIAPYNGSVEYKLTPDNFYPFRYRKGKQRKYYNGDENNNDDKVKRETSLRDIELKDKVYIPEFRREPVYPVAFVYAPKPKVQSRSSPVYKPETRQEESLPTAFVFAPIGAKALTSKPETSVYKPETRQEPVFPTAYVFMPPPKITEKRQQSPQVRRVAAVRSVKSEKSAPRSSPARTIHTPIGSRSSSPGLAPVGAVVAGGIIGATVVNKTRTPTPPPSPPKEQKKQTPVENDKHDTNSVRNISPDVTTAAVIGGTAALVHNENSKPIEKEPLPKRQETPVKEQESKPSAPPPSSPKPDNEPIKTEQRLPEQPENRNEAPAALAIVAPLSKAKKKPPLLSSQNNDYSEVPSSWSPLPFTGPSLPPEVIATIEAYDRAHGK